MANFIKTSGIRGVNVDQVTSFLETSTHLALFTSDSKEIRIKKHDSNDEINPYFIDALIAVDAPGEGV